MDRLFNLSRKSKIVVVTVLLVAVLLLSYGLFYTRNDKLISLLSNAVTAVTGVLVLSLIMFLTERKDDIQEIQERLNFFVSNIVPHVIEGRFLGEPVDSHLSSPQYALKVQVFHKEGEHHAAYRVGADVVDFEFTCLVNVYRISVFMFLPTDYDLKTVTDVCENLINTGFKLTFEPVRPSHPWHGSGHVVALLRKELVDHSAEFVFSPREQQWIAAEIREWCRTVLRKLKYEADRLAVLPIPFSELAGTPVHGGSPTGVAVISQASSES
jgi:hypothetical protein